MRRAATVGFLLIAVVIAAAAGAEDRPHWGYGAADGPTKWASLHPDYRLCAEGKQQSPIDLSAAVEGTLEPLAFDYLPAQLRIARHEHVVDVLNNGHTIQVNYDEGSSVEHGGVRYELAQYHFHAASEHALDGRLFAMEMHLVHQSEDGRLLVLGVLIEQGAHNPAFEPVWQHLPEAVGTEEHLEHVLVDVDDLIPSDGRTVRYMGSLTTPPCSEGVKWIVFAQPVELSEQQLDAFRKIVEPNHRPVQPLNGRPVVRVLAAE